MEPLEILVKYQSCGFTLERGTGPYFFVSDNRAHTANKCVFTCQLQITMAIEEIAFVNIKIELQHETVAQHLQKQSTRWVFGPICNK